MNASDGTTGSSEPGARKARTRGLFEHPKGSGVWWVCYFDEHGRRHREKVGPKSLALKVYQKRKTEVQERRFFPERIRRRDVLVSEYLQEFMAEQVSGKLRNAKHYEQYRTRWEKALRGKTLRQVLPEDIARFITQRRVAGKAPATINRELAFLRRVFNVALKNRKVDANPVTSDVFSKENNQRVRYLTADEETRLRAALGEAEWPPVAFALHTGFRQGNQFRLQWADVNFDTGMIRARHTKSGEDYFVPMNDELRALLRALPSRMRSAWVFPSATGATPLDARNYVNRVFTPALGKAGIQGFRWHDLRHTFASRLVMAGVDLRTVQELMGHKTLAMTMRYAHLSPAHKLDAVQRLNAPANAAHRATTTATDVTRRRSALAGGAQVVELPGESSGGDWNRTSDLGIMRPSL
jgi:integrase